MKNEEAVHPTRRDSSSLIRTSKFEIQLLIALVDGSETTAVKKQNGGRCGPPFR
jgi:hypothetical protein